MYPYLLGLLMGLSQSGQSAPNCPVVERVPLYWAPTVSLFESSRLELRQCGGQEGSLSIVLWEQEGRKPGLVITTSDFAVDQLLAKENVLVVETSGGTTDQVFVFEYKRGKPTLVLRQVTKGEARIETSPTQIRITISGIYAGDLSEKTKTVTISTSLSELTPGEKR